MRKSLLLSLGFIAMLTGCSSTLMDFSILSSKKIDLAKAGSYTKGAGMVTGLHKAKIIVVVPASMPNARAAMDRALASVPGAVAIVDGTLTHKWFYVPYIYGESTYIVEGTALIDPALVSATGAPATHVVAKMDRTGNVRDTKSVSGEEFEMIKSRQVSGSKH